MSEENNNEQPVAPETPEATQPVPPPPPGQEPVNIDPPIKESAPDQPQPPVGATAPAPDQPQPPVGATVPEAPAGYEQPDTTQLPYDPNQVQYGQPVQAPPAQDPYAQQPAQPQPYYAQPSAPAASGSGSGKALGALVCGILAIFFSGLVIPGIVLGIIAIVLASGYVKSFGKDGKATGGKITGIFGIAFSVIALISYIAIGVLAVMTIDQYDSSRYSSSYTYNDSTYEEPYEDSSNRDSSEPGVESDANELTAEEAALEAVALETVEAAKSPTEAQLHELMEEYDEVFTEVVTISMAEAGIDPAAVVQANLDSITFESDGVFVYSTGTGVAYVAGESAGIWEFLETFFENFDTSMSLDKDSAEDRALVGQAFMEAVAETETTDFYASFEMTQSGDTWSIDPDSLEEELEYIYGIY